MTGPKADELWDGRYRLLRRLGAGGMASVWLARDERLGRDVAVKVLSDVLAGDAEYLTRFEREAQVAAGLNHPNLVTIFDFAIAGERPYLVMELVSGGTAATRGRDGFPPDERERLAEEMLAALEHIHRAGVVHRDLKPANVLIDERGRFRLTDFGIAQPGDATSITQAGDVIGTMKYMAPEVQAGERATPRSDLYSLGILLIECGADTDPSLAALLDALTQDDPAARPASAAEAAALLRVATVPTRAMPMADARRRPGPIHAALALCTLAALALALAIASGDDGGDEAAAPAREQPERQQDAEEALPTSEPEPEEQEKPAEQEAPAEPEAASCAQLEGQKNALEAQKKAAEMAAGDDKEAKEEAKARFEEEKKALEEQRKDCRP